MAQLALSNFEASEQVVIDLPLSKSINNRVQIAHFLSNNCLLEPSEISSANDSQLLNNGIKSLINHEDIYVGDAGTAARFLTALASITKGDRLLFGTDRMHERPIKILVDSLSALGAKIEYQDQNEQLPIRIQGSELQSNTIHINSQISSQYISALMLIAPHIKDGLNIHLVGNAVSWPYIIMTQKVLQHYGVQCQIEQQKITISSHYKKQKVVLSEGDWSAALYFLLLKAFDEKISIQLEGLSLHSSQGDRNIDDILACIGFKLIENQNRISINGKYQKPESLHLDFSSRPDLAQPMAFFAISKNIPFHFTGLETLNKKETKRIEAISEIINQLGGNCQSTNDSISFIPNTHKPYQNLVLNSYNDHRMAMSYVFLFIAGYDIWIDDYMCVKKSFPHFWQELEKVGFQFKIR